MAENKKISELTQSTVITGEELIPFVLDGQNKVVKAKYLKGADNLGEDFVDIIGDDGKEYRVHIVNGEAVATRYTGLICSGAKNSHFSAASATPTAD